MVNIFIIHSGNDYDYVKEVVEPYLLGAMNDSDAVLEGNTNVLTLKSGNPSNWKRDAVKKLRLAQVVIVVIGSDSMIPSKSKTMGWEVEKAVKYHKQIYLLNPEKNDIPGFLYCKNNFTGQEELIAHEESLETIKKRIDEYSKGYYNIYSAEFERLSESEKEARNGELLDQYKLFQKSSEDLVARRQSVNSFYISVNSALVTLMGVVVGIMDTPAKLYVILFMSVTGLILDISWIHLLEAYGTLNAAKMKVINLIEEKLPIALYEVEWKVMSDKLNNKRYVSFTNSEKRVPIIFTMVYLIVILFTILYMAIN